MSLVDYFDEYESAEELLEHREMHKEWFNTLTCQELRDHFGNMGWPLIPLPLQRSGADAAMPSNLSRDG